MISLSCAFWRASFHFKLEMVWRRLYVCIVLNSVLLYCGHVASPSPRSLRGAAAGAAAGSAAGAADTPQSKWTPSIMPCGAAWTIAQKASKGVNKLVRLVGLLPHGSPRKQSSLSLSSYCCQHLHDIVNRWKGRNKRSRHQLQRSPQHKRTSHVRSRRPQHDRGHHWQKLVPSKGANLALAYRLTTSVTTSVVEFSTICVHKWTICVTATMN